MDREPGQQPAEPTVEQDGAAPSAPAQESESGVMNRLFRQVGGWLRGDDAETSGDDRDEQAAQTEATPATGEAPDESAIQERIRREAQSLKDRELARERRQWATERAEQGDLTPIRQLAEKGDRWAQTQLGELGDTWALGEIKQREITEARRTEGMTEQITGLAAHFDGAYLEPLLAALPDTAEADRIRTTTVGLDGRQQAVGTVLKTLKSHWQAEALTKALDDESFVKTLVADTAFRRAFVQHPVVNKQILARLRGEIDEPDLNPGSGPGRGGERESDVMNALIRDAWRGAEVRAPDERAAAARTSQARRGHADLLDDD